MTVSSRFFFPGVNGPMANLGLLVLRVWLGVSMLFNHGWDKLIRFNDKAGDFTDYLHIGSPTVNFALLVFAEVVCSSLLVLGLITRFGALVLSTAMGVAFVLEHEMKLRGGHSGELAFIYLAGFVALLIAGPGRYSADGIIFRRPQSVG